MDEVVRGWGAGGGVKMNIGGRVNMRDAHTVRSHTQRTHRNTGAHGAGRSNSPVELTT